MKKIIFILLYSIIFIAGATKSNATDSASHKELFNRRHHGHDQKRYFRNRPFKHHHHKHRTSHHERYSDSHNERHIHYSREALVLRKILSLALK